MKFYSGRKKAKKDAPQFELKERFGLYELYMNGAKPHIYRGKKYRPGIMMGEEFDRSKDYQKHVKDSLADMRLIIKNINHLLRWNDAKKGGR